jgi:gamma-butyrobetaine dioxygenase
MASKNLIRRIPSCLFSATSIPLKAPKPFYHTKNFASLNKPVSTASSVGIQENTNRLIVNWKDNLTDEYPLVWLRDNCQCPACFDQSSQSRTINFSHFQLNQNFKHLVSFK